jgi:hypothetical protein
MDRIISVAGILKLQKSKFDFNGDVANAAKLAKELVQLAFTDVRRQIANVYPAHRN